MVFQLPQDIRIGWIGLGEMGLGMATNLQKYLSSQSQQEYPLTVWNRSPGKSDPVEALGANVAMSMEDLVSKSNVIFTSLSNDSAVASVYETLFNLISRRQESITFVEVSTIHPTTSSEIAERLAAINVCSSGDPHRACHTYLQCPVFGRPPAAHAAELIWVASGLSEAIDRLTPYFGSMSRKMIDLHTTNVGAASSFKLIGNFFVMGTIELLAEGLNLSERIDGIDSKAVLQFIEAYFPTPSWINYSQKMVDRSTTKDGGFTVNLAVKDVGHMRSLAASHQTSLPTADLAYRHLRNLQEEGKGNQDWSSLINVLREGPSPSSPCRE
ncbi:hypothetical protein BGZ65_004288 [Modicella reniformis]|uniref:6-phosphogluconate dehydrogenase NADP-binding domain-containing protein n=1 Tax=Modicella reniformis TaxID=1440133 RepID=A0A9P6IZ38_9FUNG|nr:hypothetical protein BGZ65_004288 [Modicella reniformis]